MNARERNPYYQHTVKEPITFSGRGLHNNQPVSMTLLPATANSGIVFERLDLDKPMDKIAARWHQVTDTRLNTQISNGFGASVSTIEHLMAGLYACGVDNCRVVIDGPEVPALDGSAIQYVNRIQQLGLYQQAVLRKALLITKPVGLREKDAHVGFLPFPQPWLTMSIAFESQAIGEQNYSLPLDEHFFKSEIASARTFGFEHQLETLRSMGLAKGGTLNNGVLVRGDQVVNPEGLRYADEFVRHKLLDAVGDLALVGMPIYGRFVGHCSGHRLNNRLLRRLLIESHCWRQTTVFEVSTRWSEQVTDHSYQALLEVAS